MPYATATDGVKLYYEEAGDGTPILFIHEFAADWRGWEPQMNHFSRRHRCITYSARGYPPSDIPENVESYSQDIARADALAVLDHLGIEKAHIVGLSMGGFATLHFGLAYPDRALSLTICGCGYGAEPGTRDEFKALSLRVAENFETRGAKDYAEEYGSQQGRHTFMAKDPRGWREFVNRLAEHSDIGSALTQRGVQASRPGLWDLQDEISKVPVPAMVVTGDEDQRCLVPGLFMKEHLPKGRLFVMPNTSHVLNLEEPQLFNGVLEQFILDVESGKG
ncbi:MAG: alpha/beta hydrolase [Alphaproteobacteria bacterium]|jgi:pimeloyl-ACP methyl ester carboxylesterase